MYENKNETEARDQQARMNDQAQMNEQSHRKQMSTADIAAGSNKGSDAAQSMARGAQDARATGSDRPVLLPPNDIQALRSQWTDIQAGFVDKPRESVEGADSLVANVMQRVAETFANERSTLEEQWSRGDNVSTEDLRVTLQRYRSFFDRLLSL